MAQSNVFELYERAIIARTGHQSLDGTKVKVLGIAVEQYPIQTIYIIQRDDEALFGKEWKCIAMTSNCLDKIVDHAKDSFDTKYL